jgi:hypothetical protein
MAEIPKTGSFVDILAYGVDQFFGSKVECG